ncbi:MAG TPA: hypothetical protein VFS39_12530, partial [Nitrospira sp.]|nr:hypothetical protein [Nitrospira sp.]
MAWIREFATLLLGALAIYMVLSEHERWDALRKKGVAIVLAGLAAIGLLAGWLGDHSNRKALGHMQEMTARHESDLLALRHDTGRLQQQVSELGGSEKHIQHVSRRDAEKAQTIEVALGRFIDHGETNLQSVTAFHRAGADYFKPFATEWEREVAAFLSDYCSPGVRRVFEEAKADSLSQYDRRSGDNLRARYPKVQTALLPTIAFYRLGL